jgi:hypothetical protein
MRDSAQNPHATDLFHGLFHWHADAGSGPRVTRRTPAPRTVPCPTTGRDLRVATLDAESSAICPSCSGQGRGGFVTFEGDLRMAYACPQCRQLVWLAGA